MYPGTILTALDIALQRPGMAGIKISSNVEQAKWQVLQELATESDLSISHLLTEAIRDHVRKRRLRPVMEHLEDSMKDNFDAAAKTHRVSDRR